MLNGSLFKKIATKTLFRGLLVSMGVLVATTVVFTPYIPYSFSVKKGMMSPKTVYAPRSIEFQTEDDKRRTKELGEKRRIAVEDIYSINKEVNAQVKAEIINAFVLLEEYRKKTKSGVIHELDMSLSFLDNQVIDHMVSLDNKSFATLEYFTIQNAELMLNDGLRDIDNENIKKRLHARLKGVDLGPSKEHFIHTMLMMYLRPNRVLDEKETDLKIQKELGKVIPFTTRVRQKEVLIYEGDVVTNTHIDKLKALNIYGVKANIYKYIGILLITFLLFLMLERFVYYFNYRIYTNTKYFALAYSVIMLVLVISLILKNISIPRAPFNLLEYQFLIPIPLAAMVLSLLVTPNISLLTGTIISVLATVMFKMDFLLFTYLFLSNATAAFATYKKYKRTELIAAGYIVGVMNIVLIVMIGLLREEAQVIWFVGNMLLGLFNGVFSSMISLAILPYFESIFKITTQQKLLEYANLNHPLLKRLMMTAPGTYQHSMMVANLSEAAAEEINADPVLSRIGSYYHDIGKIKRPMFFVENQSGENPHQSLSPRMSKIIIASHTKDGYEMATKYKLPDILKEFVLQHHGTTLVSFFYTQILKTEDVKNEEPVKEEFRYPGPKPQFKESGILMLADSVEAAVRSLEKPTLTKIENLIDKIFWDKLSDNQLNECPLSLKELNQIKECFLSVFKGIYHSRFDYKKELSNIMEQSQSKSEEKKPDIDSQE